MSQGLEQTMRVHFWFGFKITKTKSTTRGRGWPISKI